MTQDETLTAAHQPSAEEEDKLEGDNAINVTLTATLEGGVINITGSGGATLPKDSGATQFNFTLIDNTGFNVKFASLDAADNSTACPPPSGENSQQITGVNIHNNQTPKTAGFTDNNSNNAAKGPMSVTYAWNFTCNPGATVNQYDPVITNGGKT